jgi:hypothetical protein
VNTAAIPARQLICLLTDTASGIPADQAAVELITCHNHFLHRPEFRRVIAAARPVLTGEPAAVIRWKAAIYALDTGRLPCTGSEQAVLRIAASLGDADIPVHLRQHLGSLDDRNINLVTTAIAHANR